MGAPDNVDRFNRIALLTLERLYSEFPVPVDIDVSALAMDTLPADASFEASFEQIEPAYYAVEFLANEGFISHQGSTLDCTEVVQARLTAKGLAVLGAPIALERKETLIEKVRSTLKGGVREAGTEAVKQVAQLVFTAAISAAQTVSGASSGGA